MLSTRIVAMSHLERVLVLLTLLWCAVGRFSPSSSSSPHSSSASMLPTSSHLAATSSHSMSAGHPDGTTELWPIGLAWLWLCACAVFGMISSPYSAEDVLSIALSAQSSASTCSASSLKPKNLQQTLPETEGDKARATSANDHPSSSSSSSSSSSLETTWKLVDVVRRKSSSGLTVTTFLVPLLLFVHLPSPSAHTAPWLEGAAAGLEEISSYGGTYFYYVLALLTSIWTTVGFEHHSLLTFLLSGSISVLSFTSVGGFDLSLWPCVALIAGALLQRAVLCFLLDTFRYSFSLGEALLVSQGISIATLDVLWWTMHSSHMHGDLYFLLMAVVLGMIFIGYGLVRIFPQMRCAQPRPNTENFALDHLSLRDTCVFFAYGLACVFGVIYPWLYHVLDGDPFVKIFSFMDSQGTPCWITLCFWIVTLLVTVFLFDPRQMSWPLIILRKYYHLVSVIMFVPPLLVSLHQFVSISFGVAFSFLLFLDYLRMIPTLPGSNEVHRFMTYFVDYRDGGHIILTHLYLLLGCAIPLWIHPSSTPYSLVLPSLAPYAGILVIGVGDALAALIGTRYGRHRWANSSKTLEGSLAAVVGVFTTMLTLRYLQIYMYDLEPLTPLSVISMLVCTLLPCMLEANTDQIDNFLLPLFTYCLLASHHHT